MAVVGPTGSGKSALAVALAQRLGGEVVNADAMQLYRGMDVGTAKLPPAERGGVAHHLLDVWDISDRASVVDYQTRARAVVSDLVSRSVPAVVVGGSGLYLRALLDDFDIPPTDAALRATLERELADVGPGRLHERLAAVDAAAAAVILPSNGRRIVRALEVVTLTGGPFAATLPAGRYHWPGTTTIGLDVDDLDVRIATRVEEMFEHGLAAEVDALVLQGLRDAPTARLALGYRQVLDAPGDPAAAAAETVRATRRFARRQRSWFRRDTRIHWVSDLAGATAIVGSLAGAT